MRSKSAHNAKSKPVDAPPTATNFRQINGINQLIEARLHRAGITSFEELANLLPEEILTAVGNLKGITVKQIVEQDWVGQSQKLSGKKVSTNGSIGSEGFIVDIFLNKKKHVHSTQILHVNSDEGAKWDSWDSARLLDFIVTRAGLELPKAAAVKAEAIPALMVNSQVPQASTDVPTPPPSSLSTPPVSELIFRSFELIPSHSQQPSKLLRKGEPFHLRVLLEAEQIGEEFKSDLDYTATIFAKDLDAQQRFRLGDVKGVLTPTDDAIVMNIPRQDLAPGTYRMEAALTLCKEAKTIGQPQQMRTIFQVF